jgi:hypothetical protein
MGVVYLGAARDRTLVAVKVLRPELTDDPEFRNRFGREVANLTRVKGVCTVRVIEARHRVGPAVHGHRIRAGAVAVGVRRHLRAAGRPRSAGRSSRSSPPFWSSR